MLGLVIGVGEVGRAHLEILRRIHPTRGLDIVTGWHGEKIEQCDVLHIATRYDASSFISMVCDYAKRFKPRIISVLSTIPPGTCQEIQDITGISTCHSTTRGLHPNLERGLRTIVKHIGGTGSDELADYFADAGILCRAHRRAETTELAHILNNLSYAVNLAFADEMSRVCRQYGVDYIEAVMDYTRTHNEGYTALDHTSKQRMVLTPPNGKIGGHCLVQNAQMIAPLLRGAGVKAPLIEMIERFNDPL